MKRTYENALHLLNTRRRTARPKDITGVNGVAALQVMPSVNGAPSFRGKPSLFGMKDWLRRLGYSDSQIDALNVVHVAGTKGKGSTCAFARSLLRAHGQRTGFPQKVGLYTSPDLGCVRERIQINEQPISEDLFTTYFFEVWERLSSSESQAAVENERMPRFLQLLLLLAFHTFIREKTEAAIFETHHGGEYDATNVIRMPAVTGVTPIGMDHVAQLGPSIENIAWHKAGVFKAGAPAFSAPQDPTAAAVLKSRAEEKGVELNFEQVDPLLPQVLEPPVQKMNCSLAIALANAFLKRATTRDDAALTLQDISQGIANFHWPGRFEIIKDGKRTWYLDGAHNELSVKQAAEWFAKLTAAEENSPRVLIFSQFSEERDGTALLQRLAEFLMAYGVSPEYVILTTYQERIDGAQVADTATNVQFKPFTDLSTYSDAWKKVDSRAVVVKESAIEGAINYARNIGQQNSGIHILITGSLHLVGGALRLLR